MEKGPDWMFDLDLLTPSMNYIPVRKENYVDSKEQGITYDDAEDLDDQQFIVHTTQPMPPEEHGVFSTNSFDAEEGGVADYNNLDPTIDVPSTPTLRIHKIHPQSQIIGKSTAGRNQESLSSLSKMKSWVEAMQEELLQFKLQEVWVLCDLPEGKRVIGTKWVFRNKRDERGTIIKNKARLVAQGYRQEEGVDYDEVFAPVARIEAIRLFCICIFHGLYVYHTDGQKCILYGNITEGYMSNPPGFEDLLISKARTTELSRHFMACIKPQEHGLQVKHLMVVIFLSQDKYVKDILNKFDFRTIKPASTPIEAHKSLGKDEEGEDVDVHLYRSMIGCLMYLTASRPDIMFAVCLCARFQVTPKVSHLHAVKRIFRYLKHQPNLGLWYPKDSPFHLEAFSDSDYAGDNHDRRSTSGGCQYLGRRLVSWQCKKQTIVAISSTEAEYVAAASCCAQVLWSKIINTFYGFNFMNTEIPITREHHVLVKNPVFHSKTKHIQIRHHFIRDCYEQRLINVVKVHTDDNVADLLTKGFDLARFKFLVVTIRDMNPYDISRGGNTYKVLVIK
ncbi:putative ribonuclease H-like domain-containing protein [Tanacetum coccineum]